MYSGDGSVGCVCRSRRWVSSALLPPLAACRCISSIALRLFVRPGSPPCPFGDGRSQCDSTVSPSPSPQYCKLTVCVTAYTQQPRVAQPCRRCRAWLRGRAAATGPEGAPPAERARCRCGGALCLIDFEFSIGGVRQHLPLTALSHELSTIAVLRHISRNIEAHPRRALQPREPCQSI